MAKSKKTDTSKSFSIDARIILNLGRESIKDHTTALIELVKNSYDADATKVDIEIYCNTENPFIRISDNGVGMTEKIIDDSWLRIGYSAKRKAKVSSKDRRKTGEKGIGRLSSDRLGSVLDLKTKAANKKSIGLKVNWDDFNVDGKELAKVPIQFVESPDIKLPMVSKKKSKTGTELVISKLRHNWSAIDVENLYEELSLLTPPFKKVVGFSINLSTDVVEGYSKKVESPFIQKEEIRLVATYNGVGEDVSYRIKDKYGISSNKKILIPWVQLVQIVNKGTPEFLFSDILNCGPVEIIFLFYPRDITIIEGTGFKLPDLKEFLNKNAGVKIYRDNIRVKPYGNQNESEGDWLGLNNRKQKRPDGISKSTWVAGGHQIIGGVFITRDGNKELVDSSSREGLIDGKAISDLRSLSLGCLSLLEAHRHDVHKRLKKKTEVKNKPATERVTGFQEKLEAVKSNFESLIESSLPKSEKKKVATAIKEVEALIENSDDSASKVIEELIGQNRLLGGLATIGIASAIFGHETESSIGGIGVSIKAAMALLSKKKPNIDLAKEELRKSLDFSKEVNAWGRFALTRIKKNKRKKTKTNISTTVDKLLNEFEPAFIAANIKITRNFEDVQGRVFQMDIETIIINLLTNAYSILTTWGKERKIIVEVKNHKKERDGFIISLEDSGHGINDKFIEKIWEPLFTLKTNKSGKESGTGLGLSIISSIITEANGTKEILKSKKLGGAKFVFWLPKR